MAAFEDGKIAQQDVAAVFERDGLVADARLLGNIDGVIAAGVAIRAETQAFAVDQARAGDAEVVHVFAP